MFMLHAKAMKLPAYEREHRFCQERKWRFDFAWPERKVAAEVEGGVWNQGRHSRGLGFTQDCDKYNHAAMLGWRVFRFTTEMVKTGAAMVTMVQVLEEPR